jgi:rubrerythrin
MGKERSIERVNDMESDFAAVWGRVTGEIPAENELSRLRRWIRDEAEECSAYEELLHASLPSAIRETLRGILREERRHLKQLQTLYYLRTGDSAVPAHAGNGKRMPFLQAMRERYAAELSQSESYGKAAAEKKDLAALCLQLSAEEEMHALQLRRIMERLL